MRGHGCLLRWLLASLLAVLPACSTSPELDLTLHESAKGSVYLERIPDRSFQAAHPITLPADTMTKVLRGIHVHQATGTLKNLFTGKEAPTRAFSDDDVAYLAPLLVEGFRQAAPDQQVGFRITQLGAPGYVQSAGAGMGSSEPPLQLHPVGTTSGSLYAFGRSLYVTLNEYRHRTEPPNTINMANRRLPDPTGLHDRTVAFAPDSARRPERFRDARSTDATLIIDYELLATLPSEPDGAVTLQPTSAPSHSPQVAPSAPADKDAELEAIRKELQEIKQKLADQEAGQMQSRKQSGGQPQPAR